MTLEAARQIADEYRKTLTRMKREGIDLDTAPLEVQEAALALHQHALLVWTVDNRPEALRHVLPNWFCKV